MRSNPIGSRRARLLLLIGLSAPAAAAAEALATEESAYQELLDQARAAPANPRNIVRFRAGGQNCEVLTEAPSLMPVALRSDPANANPARNVRLALKVWVELARPDGQSRSGQFVNLEQHAWRPAQPFYLWFESATPVHIALFQIHVDKSTAISRARLVLPSARIPASFDTLRPGMRARFPILLRTDNDLVPEELAVVARTPGVPLAERTPLLIDTLPRVPGDARIQEAMLGTCRQLETALNFALASGPETPLGPRSRFTITAPDRNDGPTTDPRQVAAILLGAEPIAHTRFTLKKSP